MHRNTSPYVFAPTAGEEPPKALCRLLSGLTLIGVGVAATLVMQGLHRALRR